ncbi:MAG: response regulator [Candidatus Bathyarchaeia archaeon]|jgi:DNA-binding NtrC family response regulator
MSEAEKGRILVIDDDEGTRKVIAEALKSEDYLVDTASNGKEAIEKSQNNFYNLALVDIRLPDMEGTKLLTAMKETTPEMIKIILTGYPALQNAIDAVNKGAHGYLVKPINMDELLRTVEQHLKKQSEMKEYGQQKVGQFVETRFKELQAEELDTPQTRKKE